MRLERSIPGPSISEITGAEWSSDHESGDESDSESDYPEYDILGDSDSGESENGDGGSSEDDSEEEEESDGEEAATKGKGPRPHRRGHGHPRADPLPVKSAWKPVTDEDPGEGVEPPAFDPNGDGSHGPTFSLTAEQLQDPCQIFDRLFPVSLRKTIAGQTNLYRAQQAVKGSITLVDTITNYNSKHIDKYVAVLITRLPYRFVKHQAST